MPCAVLNRKYNEIELGTKSTNLANFVVKPRR